MVQSRLVAVVQEQWCSDDWVGTIPEVNSMLFHFTFHGWGNCHPEKDPTRTDGPIKGSGGDCDLRRHNRRALQVPRWPIHDSRRRSLQKKLRPGQRSRKKGRTVKIWLVLKIMSEVPFEMRKLPSRVGLGSARNSQHLGERKYSSPFNCEYEIP